MEFEERVEPTFVKFVRGEQLEGILLKMERVLMGEPPKPVVRYTVMEQVSREMFCFLGSYQIDTKIRREDRGHVIQVTYVGDDDSVKRNGNSMKVFKVMVSKQLAPGVAADSTLITDDDIPF